MHHPSAGTAEDQKRVRVFSMAQPALQETRQAWIRLHQIGKFIDAQDPGRLLQVQKREHFLPILRANTRGERGADILNDLLELEITPALNRLGIETVLPF